jgi:beta-N-acetylhexosaminidase
LLRGELGFGGVVVTDSIDMRAIRDRYSPEEAVVAAIDAGADLVVDAFNLEPREEHPAMTLVRALRRAVDEGSLRGGEARIRESLGRLAGLRRVLGRES